jgi:hypothetical protein
LDRVRRSSAAVETPKINLMFREGKLPIGRKGDHFAK